MNLQIVVHLADDWTAEEAVSAVRWALNQYQDRALADGKLQSELYSIEGERIGHASVKAT